MTRPTWDEYFMNQAFAAAERGTCPRLKVGTVIVKDKRIISTGYNGSIRGHDHCIDKGCILNEEGRCIRTLHSEENAILFADRHLLEGAILYCTHEPCERCTKMIAQVGIRKVVFFHPYRNKYNHYFNQDIEWVLFKKEECDDE